MLGKFAAFKLKLKNNRKLRYAQIGIVLAVLFSAGVYFIYGNPRVMIPIRTSDEYLNAVIMSFKFSDWYWAVRTAVVVALIAAVRAVHLVRSRAHFAFAQTGVAVIAGIRFINAKY